MQTHPPPPLDIPSEEDSLPLFDPSGLSASVSADDWASSFDHSSVAAARLGIASPPASSNALAADGTTPSSPDQDAEKRGRRRRSSPGNGDDGSKLRPALGEKQTSVSSKVRMWWDRSAETDEEQEEQIDDVEQAEPRSAETVGREEATPWGIPQPSASGASIPNSKGMSPLAQRMLAEKRPHPRVDTSAQAGPSHARAASQEVSVSPVARSPAADFLSNFSSLHSVVASPGPVSGSLGYESRSLSYSPPRPGQRGPVSNLAREDRRIASSPLDGAWHGLGSAAARLYGEESHDHALGSNDSGVSLRPDDEGARVGPRGRYLLGKTIGFGGFSTVKEGWDLESEGLADPSAPVIDGAPKGRKVAIKIVYRDEAKGGKENIPKDSHELDIWRSLPSHLHLLPLLHSEEVTLPSADPDSTKTRHAELLVMPFCDEGNLLDFVRTEGGAKTISLNGFGTDSRPPSVAASEAGGSPYIASLSRRNSLNNNGSYTGQSAGSIRTGSGFIHRINRVVSASGSMQSAIHPSQLQFTSASSSPVSASGSVTSSGLLRRASSKATRSNGVPIEAARETMRQIASALLSLHTKAKVLHGDLKLENVLGQGQTSTWKQRARKLVPEATAEDDGAPPSSPTTSVVSSTDGLFDIENAMPCWRLADFGLAQKVEKGRREHSPNRIVDALQEGVANGSDSAKSRPGRGGSLAYTAPEFLRGAVRPGTEEESPYAADMWALGCILYALLSGRLPFADSFEPRLQMKIAKAQWEVPPRLKRRAERLAAASMPGARHSRERSGSIGLSADLGKASLGRRSGASLFGPARAITLAGTTDLSASLPSLPAREKQANLGASSLLATHSEHVVGSAPGRADHAEINEEAKALADAEVDPESDNDESVDPAWDGLSWDRAAAREVLYGLLEPEPCKRWTIHELCASPWLKDETLALPSVASGLSFAPASSQLNGVTALTADVHDEGPTRRPSLITQCITERPSQEAIQTFDFSKRPTSPSRGEGRRASSLARLRPTELDSGAASPRDDASITSSIRERSDSRSRSSESSTPSRLDIFPTHPWAIQRADSPAERGSNSRPRMADLDENRMWTADPSDRRMVTGRVSGPVPIPIRSQSHSRSRSRHSQGETDRTEVHHASTSRSRSRAPDALASILAATWTKEKDEGGRSEEPRGRARERS